MRSRLVKKKEGQGFSILNGIGRFGGYPGRLYLCGHDGGHKLTEFPDFKGIDWKTVPKFFVDDGTLPKSPRARRV